MERTKWGAHTFTETETKARKQWQHTWKRQVELLEALHACAIPASRDEWHAKLDRELDKIDRVQSLARAAFPEVENSFTIATETIRL